MFRCILTLVVLLFVSLAAHAGFTITDQKGALTLLENKKPVMVYHYESVPAQEGVAANFARACYIHPLYGLDGEIMTDDFPADHRHHRGVFWAWPECTVDGRRLDPWALKDTRQHHEQFLKREADAKKAVISVQNRWAFDDAPDKAIVREEITFTVHPVTKGHRAIDFDMTFTNVSDNVVTFLGAKNKGYGGLCYRPDANSNRQPITFTHSKGEQPQREDMLRCESPWADLTTQKPTRGVSGVAIFQNAQNPGYPHPGWMMRHYGFLGVSWPHEETYELQPGKSFHLVYRLLIHRGSAKKAGVAKCFEAYASGK